MPPIAPSKPWTQRFTYAVGHPGEWLRGVAGGAAIAPLIILFALNAVDELGRSAFQVLAPDIAEYFDTGIGGLSTIVGIAFAAALGLTVWVATLADRYNRVYLTLAGGLIFAFFSAGIGLSVNLWMLGIMLACTNLGKSVIEPTHNSLLADYYPVEARQGVYSFHRAGNAVGGFIGPVTAGLIASAWGWRAPFLIFAVPTVLLVLVGMRLKEPVRGAHERRMMGASEDTINTEEEAPSFAEAWRMCWKIDSLRRIYRTLPFLAPALVGFLFFAGFLYADVFGLDERARGVIGSITEPFQLVGLTVGASIGLKLFRKDPKLVFQFIAWVIFAVTGLAAVFAMAPNVVVAVIANILISGLLALVVPGIFAALSLAIPARARAMGFSMASVFFLPGLLILPLIGTIADVWGVRWGMLVMTPVFLLGAFAIGSAGSFISRDIQDVWNTTAARSEVLYERRQGRSKLLLIRGLNVSYGDVQVLFDVDLEIDKGEIVALLGTNGAGKSTLLKAISGVVEADKGAVILDGRDITHAPPNEIAAKGVMQIPGGQGVFPSLSVAENLRVAGWMNRKRPKVVQAGIEHVFEQFPILRERAAEPAVNLSGGQQQMLAIGMAFLSEPQLLMIDELSLGLAPVVVEQLLPVVRSLREKGTTVIVVEQSVNIALTLAEEAYFMEKGEIRFHGSTAELLERPDVLRSVFLEGAESGMRAASEAADSSNGATPTVPPNPDGGADSVTVTSVPAVSSVSSVPADSGEPADSASPEVGPALELRDVSRRFGGIRAVDTVSFTVTPGEILGVIGPNGAGKTTLFDLISGYTPVDAGRILLSGTDVTDLPAHVRATRGLGRSFQDARLFPGLTVEETIKVSLDRWTDVRDPLIAALHLPASFDSEEAVQRRTDELIDLLGLEAFRSKFVRELSTGSRRIVDLACLVAHRPSVILLDEPSSGIAQRETEALGPMLLRIRERLGASLVVIEHDMPLITRVSDRLLALEQGHVVTEGEADHVLHHPEVVASYLGTTDEIIARSGSRSGI